MVGKIIVIAGPTASGKTRLSLSAAAAFGGEIVSADSMQIYRGMDIGTAKATAEEQSAAPHHMIDIADPEEDYSVARYVDEASACCDEILSRGRVPIVTGGTGLYIDSLISGRTFADSPEDPALRQRLNDEYEGLGGEEMLRRLASFDPERAEKLHPADRKRILRAIEIYELTGTTITKHDAMTRAIPPRYDASYIVTGYRDRSLLYDRINQRVDEMLYLGLFDEVRTLIERGVSPRCTAMQAIGYKEAVDYLDGGATAEEAAELIKLGSRRYAKRQITWFGRREDAFRLYIDDYPDFGGAVAAVLDYLRSEGF